MTWKGRERCREGENKGREGDKMKRMKKLEGVQRGRQARKERTEGGIQREGN